MSSKKAGRIHTKSNVNRRLHTNSSFTPLFCTCYENVIKSTISQVFRKLLSNDKAFYTRQEGLSWSHHHHRSGRLHHCRRREEPPLRMRRRRRGRGRTVLLDAGHGGARGGGHQSPVVRVLLNEEVAAVRFELSHRHLHSW